MIELAFNVQLTLRQILERLRGGGELLASNKSSHSRITLLNHGFIVH